MSLRTILNPIFCIVLLFAFGAEQVRGTEIAAQKKEVSTRLKIESECAFAGVPPVAVAPIGNQLLLLSRDGAWLMSPLGDAAAVARGRDLQDFGIAYDARSAFAIGGRSMAKPSAGIWRLNLGSSGVEWTQVAVLPAPSLNPVSVVYGSSLWVAGRSVDGLLFFVKINVDTGVVGNIDLPNDCSEVQSLGAQEDHVYLAGLDSHGACQLWRRESAGWTKAQPPPKPLLAGPPVPVGMSHLVYAVAGPSSSLQLYHTITNTWVAISAPGGEVAGMALQENRLTCLVKTTEGTWMLRTQIFFHPKRGLTYWDYLMLGGYFCVALGIGFLCSKRKANSDDYFRGGGKIQWWALGISYMATAISSISFMGNPAASYSSSWLLVGVPIAQVSAVIFTGITFIGIFRRLNITTVFEYLEARFGRTVRLLGAVLMILGQVGGRLSIIMLFPALAFSAVTGLNVYVSVLLTGFVTIAYCLKGGMKAVVWTDVLQVGLMYGAVVVTIGAVSTHVPGGFGGLFREAIDRGKFTAFISDFNVTQPTIWVFACLAVTTVFLQLNDQSLMQRALSAQDEKTARNSVVLAGLLALPISLMLFLVGTALFVFYRHRPELLDPTLPTDSIFPFFVGNELPTGLVGLIMAGIFAAVMSAVSGSINSLSAIVVRDFYVVRRPRSTEGERVRLAKISTLVFGVLATGIATYMASMNIKSLWQAFAALVALIGGGFPGVFALGLLTRRANTPGALVGMGASFATTILINHFSNANVFLHTSVAVGTCMLVGYTASFFFAPPTKSLAGLTVHSLKEKRGTVGIPCDSGGIGLA